MLKSALRDSLIYGLATVLSRGMAFFLLPLYTHVLTVSQYGAYDLLITLGALANLTIALEISQGLARHWAEAANADEKRRLASTALFFSLGMYGFWLAVALWFAEPLASMILGDSEYLPAFRMGLLFIAANGLYLLLLNQFRWQLRSRAYASVSIAYALLTVCFAVLFCVLLDMKLVGVMLAQFTAAAGASLACFYMLRSSYGRLFDTRLLKKMLLFSAPLVPAGFLVFLNLYVNRLALNHFMSLEEVGVFGIASRIAGIAALLIIGIRAALTPLIYENHRRPETPGEIATLFGWFLAFAFPACLFLSVFAREAILVLAKPAYAEAASLVIYLAPAMLMSQMYIFAPGIVITKKTHWQFWLTLASATVSVVANLALVPLAGVTGAAIATLARALVFFFGWVRISQRLYPVPYAWPSAFLAMLCFTGLSSLGVWIDASEMSLWPAITAKALLLLAMLVAVVALKLLPAADLRKLVSSLIGRLRPSSGK